MIFKFDIWKTYLVEGELQKYTYIFLNPDKLHNRQLVSVFPFANLTIIKSYQGTTGAGTTPTPPLQS